MKIIYKSIASALFLTVGVFGMSAAEKQDKLNVVTANGVPTEFDLSKIGKLTFDGNHFMIHLADGTRETIAIKDIDKLIFDLEISSVGEERIEAVTGTDINIIVENNVMTVTELNNKPLNVMVFNANGMRVAATKGIGSLQVDFNTMTPGMYIIKANDRIIKYLK